MHFDPQSNFLSEEPSRGAPSAGSGLLPRRGLRGQVVAFAAAVAGVLAVWIWQQSNTPASASGAANEPPPQPQPEAAPPTDAAAPAQNDVAEPAPPKPAPATDDDQTSRAQPADGHEQSGTLEFHYTAEPTEAQRQRAAELLAQGKRALAMRNSDKAIRALREAVQLDPGSADAHYNLGLAYVLADDHQSAHRQRRELQALDPSLASLLDNLIR